MIKKAVISDIDKIEESYIELLKYEEKHGSNSNWKLDVYPTREVAVNSFNNGTLYVLSDNDEVCASMILNHVQAEDYKNVMWKYDAKPEEVLVIHTLCIPPSKAGNGYGKMMVSYAIKKAAEMNCKVIRLDTFAKNKPAANLYKGLGFEYSGTAEVLHNGLIKEQLIFFELSIHI